MIEMNLLSLILSIGPGYQRAPAGRCDGSTGHLEDVWRVLLGLPGQQFGLSFRDALAGCWRGLAGGSMRWSPDW